MSEISRDCTLFTTTIPEEKLAKLLLGQENRATGAGGYAIERSQQRPGDAIDISFHYLDSTPSPKHHAFVKDGKIWATAMSGWLTDLLRRNKIRFTTRQVTTPPFIATYMEKLIVDDKRRERRYG